MRREQVAAAETAFAESLAKLTEALDALVKEKGDARHRSMHADAAVKRFEVAFEYCWKLLKAAVEYQGGEAFGPRPAIQEAVRFGWIDDPEFWAQALDARNGSVHDYFGISDKAYAAIMKRFVGESEALLKKIKAVG